MAFGSESQKKSYCVLEDVYGMVMVPKEMELEKESSFELRFQVPDFGRAMKSFVRTREVGEFLSGALAGAMTKAVLAPLETIRMRPKLLLASMLDLFKIQEEKVNIIQHPKLSTEFKGKDNRTRMVVGVGSREISGSFIEVIEKQGWQGLWAGNTINMLRIIPTQAIELGTFEFVKRAMASAQEKQSQSKCPKVQIGRVSLDLSFPWVSPVAVGGAAAGFVSTLICHPLEVLKDRLTVSPEAYPSISIALRKIYKDGGIGGFYAGISPTLIGMLPYSTCFYFMYEKMKKSYCQAKKKKSLNRPEMLLFGALSGFMASTISFPLEVARKRLMVGALQGKCPANMAAALSEVIKEEGLRGLYRGWGASCLKVMPSSGITWMFYEAWKDILLVERHLL
ncbi:hypothetical protein HHK36_013485 [Tetracentron sinense]|uniref:Mitochondrial adenine nucleotide transporter BTL1 n=1 Tax=Tetracentron sinense TaxID=13715 RepID=A0A835DHE1_TETSI|nr:hypothetical protein HHK36_013485 [Tetracentron sinense]